VIQDSLWSVRLRRGNDVRSEVSSLLDDRAHRGYAPVAESGRRIRDRTDRTVRFAFVEVHTLATILAMQIPFKALNRRGKVDIYSKQVAVSPGTPRTKQKFRLSSLAAWTPLSERVDIHDHESEILSTQSWLASREQAPGSPLRSHTPWSGSSSQVNIEGNLDVAQEIISTKSSLVH
jgi:hypothetical protein